jgi:hypothetical protein
MEEKKIKYDNSGEERYNDLKELLEKNIKTNEEVLEKVKYIKGYITWQRVFSVIKILLIIIPLALGAIFLPPLVKDLLAQYQSLF